MPVRAWFGRDRSIWSPTRSCCSGTSRPGEDMVLVRATYRLQLHAGFPLARARALVPYLSRLGVSHIHCSPLLQARRGSTHGYDVVDPTRLDPELGTEEELGLLHQELAAHDMGLVLDIVPNH